MKVAKRISLPGVLAMTAGLVYTFLALQSSRGDWREFWLGKHA